MKTKTNSKPDETNRLYVNVSRTCVHSHFSPERYGSWEK